MQTFLSRPNVFLGEFCPVVIKRLEFGHNIVSKLNPGKHYLCTNAYLIATSYNNYEPQSSTADQLSILMSVITVSLLTFVLTDCPLTL